MATQVQFRRGNTYNMASFTGANGEVVVDTEKETVVIHDGVTSGGFAVARESNTVLRGSNSQFLANQYFSGTSHYVAANATFAAGLNSSNLSVSNSSSTSNVYVNTSSIYVGNSTTSMVINSSAIAINGALVANSSGTNNAFYLGGVIASGYQTTAGLSANVATLSAYNTSYVGSVAAANVVSNTQLQSNLSNYQTSAGLNANVGSYLPTHAGVVNATSHTTGDPILGTGGLIANVTTLYIGNNTINASLTTTGLNINATTIANTSGFFTSGIANATTVNANLAGSYASLSGQVNTATLYVTTSANVGTILIANSTGITTTGNASLASGVVTVNSSLVNSTQTINATSHTTGATGTGSGGLVANTSTVFIGNNTINTFLNTIGLNVNAVTIANTSGVYTLTVNAASHTTGGTGNGAGGLVANTTTVFIGNNSVNTTLNTIGLNINTATVANTTGVYTGVVNATSYSAGANGVGTGGLTITATSMSLGNNTINSAINTTSLSISGNLIANSTGANNAFNFNNQPATYYTNATNIISGTLPYAQLGSAIVNTSANFSLAGNISFTGTFINAVAYNTGSIGTGTGGSVQNTTTLFLGNNTVNTFLTTTGLNVNASTIANTTGVYAGVVNATSLSSGNTTTGTGGFVANSSGVLVGNNTVNTVINSTSLSIGGSQIANSGGANNAFNLGGLSASAYQLANGFNSNAAAYGYINTSSAYTMTGVHTHSANLIMNATLAVNSVIALNGSNGIALQVLTSNGNSNAYWGTLPPPGNTFQSYTWSNNQTFQANVTVGNYIFGNFINATSYTSGATGTGAGGLLANVTTLFIGNNTVNAFLTTTGLSVNSVTVANTSGVYTTGTVNSASINTVSINATSIVATSNIVSATFISGSNLSANSTSITFTGNTTTAPTITLANTGSLTIGNGSTTQTTSVISIANSSSNVQITPAGITGNGINISSVNAVALGGFSFTAPANIGSITANGATFTNVVVSNITSISYGAGNTTTGTGGLLANSTTLLIGNNTINTFLTTTGLNINAVTIANTTGVYTGVVNGSSLSVGTTVVANSTTLNANGFIANSTGVYTGVVNGSSLSVGTSTVANSTGVYTGVVNGSSLSVGTSTVANSTGVYTGVVNGSSITVGSSFVANSTGITTTGIVNAASFSSPSGGINAASYSVSGTVVANTSGVYDSLGHVRAIPVQTKTATYQLAATDNGTTLSTNSGVTVNGSVLSTNHIFTIFNNSASSITITQGSGTTIYFAGSTTTGSRTLANYGVVTLLCVAANTFVISGAGLS